MNKEKETIVVWFSCGAMPLTDEEVATLASLSGKEKKKYIKELKQKYSQY